MSLYTLLGASLVLFIVNSRIHDKRACSQRLKTVGWCFKGLLIMAILLSSFSLYQSYEAIYAPPAHRQATLATWVTWLMNSIAVGHVIAVIYAIFLGLLYWRTDKKGA